MKDINPMVLFRALNLWDYNVEAVDKFAAVYGARPDGDPYKGEKVMSIATRTLAGWSGDLDYAHQQKLVQAALDRYGEEAERWVASNENFLSDRRTV